MYHGEFLKPSNAGAFDCRSGGRQPRFQWTRTDFEPGASGAVAAAPLRAHFGFPHEYAEAEHCISSPLQLPEVATGQTPLFIMLDGTWREAKNVQKPVFTRLARAGHSP